MPLSGWKRIVPHDDATLVERYGRLMDYLGWPEVVEMPNDKYYFRANGLCRWLIEDPPMGGGVSLQDMAIAQSRGQFTLKEWTEFYVGIGYPLDGFLDIFADKIWPEIKDGRPNPGGRDAP